MDTLKTSQRIQRLHNQLLSATADVQQRMWIEDDACRAYAKLAEKVFAHNRDEPELSRKAAFLRAFAEEMPIDLYPDELIVGNQTFGMRQHWGSALTLTQDELACHGNMGHVVVDYGRMLKRGLDTVAHDIDTAKNSNPDQKGNYPAFAESLTAFQCWIERHAEHCQRAAQEQTDPLRRDELLRMADNCQHIAHKPAATFWQGLQLVWFMQVFLHAEGNGAAVSFGRFDQYLWPLLEADLAAQRMNMARAEELLACFFIKVCQGDESQNLVVGGKTAAGDNAENPLSLICLNVVRELRLWQPSLSVRIHADSSSEFWQGALTLAATGIGQPSFFNDAVVTAALQCVDIPLERARDWAIVGCYEATPQGDALGYTVAGKWNLPQTLLDFLHDQRAMAADRYDAFYQSFLTFLNDAWAKRLAEFENRWQHCEQALVSPFESVCLTGCIESGLAAEQGGAHYSLFGVNILGLATLVDSLYAVKTLLYEQQAMTMSTLCEQLSADWSDPSLQLQCRHLPGKFGTDAASTNQLAQSLSQTITDMVRHSRIANGKVRPYPGFFAFGADINHDTQATPDGRAAADALSYGCGPTAFAETLSATSILNSAAHAAHHQSPCGNPLTLTFATREMAFLLRTQQLQQLIAHYFAQGGFHLHFNAVDAQHLRQAQQTPDHYGQLVVRISGFSAKFTSLDKKWQDVLIERAAVGM